MKHSVTLLFALFSLSGISARIHGPRSLTHSSLSRQRRLETTQAPTVTTSVFEPCVDVEDSGGNEPFTLTLTVQGGGATSTSSTPIDVVFAIDSSGSMTVNDPSNLRLAAAKSFVARLDSNIDKAAVVSWDGKVDFTQGLTNDFTLVDSKIDLVDSSGFTNLNAGLYSAIGLLDSNPRTEASVEVIIFLTDGRGAYTSFSSNGPALDASDKGYVIYSIGLGSASSLAAFSAPLQDMADNTGGAYYSAPDAGSLQNIYDAIFEEVTLSTVPHNVDVTVELGGCITDVTAITPGSGVLVPGSSVTWTAIDQLDGEQGMRGDEFVTLSLTAKSSCSGADQAVLLSSSSLAYTPHDDPTVSTVSIDGNTVNVNLPPVAECMPSIKPVDASCSACFDVVDVNNNSFDDYTCPANDLPALTLDPPNPCFTGVGSQSVLLTATDTRALSGSCEAIVMVTNDPPVAFCAGIEVNVNNDQCQYVATSPADLVAMIDTGSYDPEGHPLDIVLDINGPFELGATTVTLTVTDSCGEQDTCQAEVIVVDPETLNNPELLDCGGDGVITPCDTSLEAPLTYIPAYTKANGCSVDVSVVDEGCSFCNGAGKTVDKLAGGSCNVGMAVTSFTISDSGGVEDFIHFSVNVCNEGTYTCNELTCTICVETPAGSCNDDGRDLQKQPGKGGGPFFCPDLWDPTVDYYSCADLE